MKALLSIISRINRTMTMKNLSPLPPPLEEKEEEAKVTTNRKRVKVTTQKRWYGFRSQSEHMF